MPKITVNTIAIAPSTKNNAVSAIGNHIGDVTRYTKITSGSLNVIVPPSSAEVVQGTPLLCLVTLAEPTITTRWTFRRG